MIGLKVVVTGGELVVVDDCWNLCRLFGFGETLLEEAPLPPVFLFLAAMFDLTLGAELGLLVVAKNGLELGDSLEDGLGVGDELENGLGELEKGLSLGELENGL